MELGPGSQREQGLHATMRWGALCYPSMLLGTLFSEQGEKRLLGRTVHCRLAVSSISKLPLSNIPFRGAGGPGRAWEQQELGSARSLPSYCGHGVRGGCLPEACWVCFLLAEPLSTSVSAFLRVKCLSEIKKRESSRRMVQINLWPLCPSGSCSTAWDQAIGVEEIQESPQGTGGEF